MSNGLFWENTGKARARVMPYIPDNGWSPPKEFPNLSAAKAIALDTETYDPELLNKGPGWARGDGHIVGVSIGVDGCKWYYPLRHEVEPHDNLDPAKVLRWLNDVLATPNVYKIGANLMYDIGWLRQEGVNVTGPLFDVQYAEALLSETSKVSLDVLGHKYLNIGKTSDLLYQWCADYYGGTVSAKQRANIYRAPARLVGPYAEDDADLPLRLAPIMWRKLADEKLTEVMEMECALVPLLVDMRFAGVTVDIDKAEQARDKLSAMSQDCSAKIRDLVGFDVNVNASASLAQAFDTIGLKYPMTAPSKSYPDGQPSFTKLFLGTVKHPLATLINNKKKYDKTVGTFIDSYILGSHVNGKVHGQFHPLRKDGGGTRSGRYSSSTPNLQNLSSRDKLIAPIIRGLFIPHAGHKSWFSADYSQIEYRMLVHFALGAGADAVRQQFCGDPTTDYHKLTQKLVEDHTGLAIDRKPIKNINFGLLYGMGVDKLSAQIGLSKKEGKKLFEAYHKGAPFAKATMEHYMSLAQNTGVIETILGRKSRFDLWEPLKWDANTVPLPYNRALAAYGRVRRAHTHKALNRLLQGSAADIMKMAMLKMYRAGLFDVLGPPVSTVHDEINISRPHGKEATQALREVVRIMEHAIDLKVPIMVDVEEGPNWGALGESDIK